MLEPIQRRAGRWMTANYDPRARVTNMLQDLELDLLEKRRNAQVTLMFKVLHGYVGIRPQDINLTFFDTCTQSGHSMKLQHHRSYTTQHCNWFTTLTIPEWNI